MIGILIFSAGISLGYIILIAGFIKGWNKIPEYSSTIEHPHNKVSIIIAFRNEEINLPALLKALEDQSYNHSEFEVIFADDHSEDSSAGLISEFISRGSNFRLIRLEKQDYGKKKAVAIAAAEALGELLIFTDADCVPEKDWVRSIVSFYNENNFVLIAAPVLIEHSGGFLSRFQSLEFLSLIGSTAGSFGSGDPIMLNGANMAVPKSIYLDSISFLQNQISSGDDVFLLLHLKKLYPGRLGFLKSSDATVKVDAQPDVFSFLRQRIRWTSKARFYRDKSIIVTSVIVLLINLWMLNCFIMSFFNFQFIIIGGVVFLSKTVVDYVFMRKVLKFFRMESLLRFFALSQFLYFLYISFTGIAGNFLPSRWKGRVVK